MENQMREHHHHHHNHPTDHHRHDDEDEDDGLTSWKNDLFEWQNARLYCFNLVCPCFSMQDIYRQIIHSKSSHDIHHPTTSAALSLLSCILPSCLAVNEGIRWGRGRGEAANSNFWNDAQPHPHGWSETAEAALPILSMMHRSDHMPHPEDVDTEFIERVEGNMQGLTCIWVLMGAMCIVPYVFVSRRAVQAQMHHTPKEPLWETGLISLFAWPCALTQVQEELA